MIIHGDSLKVLKTLDDNSIDSVVTDPPYALGFMGKEWDTFDKSQFGRKGLEGDNDLKVKKNFNVLPRYTAKENGFQEFCYDWAKECLRVLKPGGHLLSFGGSRTYHRMAVAIEDAGFEIRDQIMWVYGCLSEDTEILTKDGWKRYHKAILNDSVLCYNIDNDSYEYHKPTDKFWYKNEHTAYRIKSDTTDQIVSRNHRVLVERNGRKVFAYAETLQRQENIPILESLYQLPDTIYDAHERTSATKQDLLKRVFKNTNRNGQLWQETDNDTMQSLQENVLPDWSEQEQAPKSMLKRVQRCIKRTRLEKTRIQGQSQLETRERTGTNRKNDRRNKPKLERWFNLSQSQGQIRRTTDKICQMSTKILNYGTQRRLCYGTSAIGSTTDWQTTYESRERTSYKPRRNRQQNRQLNAIQDERGTQTLRVGASHNTTLATVEPIEYSGHVWCVTVPTGAFVARRNGQIFITGNSGFPKSLNIGKAVDKLQGNEKPSTYKPNDKNAVYGKNYGGGVTDNTPADNEWNGWGTALKPSHEPIVVARKPISVKNIAENVLKWGTGGINIDGCRVEFDENEPDKRIGTDTLAGGSKESLYGDYSNVAGKNIAMYKQGRFPANFIHDGSDEVVGLFPNTKSGSKPGQKGKSILGSENGETRQEIQNAYGDSGSAARFFMACKDDPKRVKLKVCIKNGNVRIAEKDLAIMSQTERIAQMFSALKNVVQLSTSLDQNLSVLSAGNLADSTEISFVQNLVATLTDGTTEFTGEQKMVSLWLKKLTQEQLLNILIELNNLARFAGKEVEELKDTIQTISNLKTLYGYVDLATYESIPRRFVYQSKASKSERNKGLEGFEKQTTDDGRKKSIDNAFQRGETERHNNHPTVKPVRLMQYLVRLVTPPQGTVLDPFNGSGTTGVACKLEGFDYIGIEREAEYVEISKARIEAWEPEEDNKQLQLI